MNIKININSLDDLIEKMVIEKIDKNPAVSYIKMDLKELDDIYNIIINNFSKDKTKVFSKKIILSIRATLMREHMINRHSKIKKNINKIINDYNNKLDIKSLMIKYDGSPLNLLRLIFQKKYNSKLTKIIKNTKILDEKDKTELEWAILNDAYALVNQDKILKRSVKFEKKIQKILDKISIKYKTQEQLAKEQLELNNKISNTPDFLILSDLYINDIKINWIDAKNFYCSDNNFMNTKIISQTNKYIDKWGIGSVIFNLGFNSNLNFNDILLIDYKSFEKSLK